MAKDLKNAIHKKTVVENLEETAKSAEDKITEQMNLIDI